MSVKPTEGTHDGDGQGRRSPRAGPRRRDDERARTGTSLLFALGLLARGAVLMLISALIAAAWAGLATLSEGLLADMPWSGPVGAVALAVPVVGVVVLGVVTSRRARRRRRAEARRRTERGVVLAQHGLVPRKEARRGRRTKWTTQEIRQNRRQFWRAVGSALAPWHWWDGG